MQNRTSLDVRGPEDQAMRGAGIRPGHVPSDFLGASKTSVANNSARPVTALCYKDAHTTQPKPRLPLILSHSAVLTGGSNGGHAGPLRHTPTTPSGATMLPSRVQQYRNKGPGASADAGNRYPAVPPLHSHQHKAQQCCPRAEEAHFSDSEPPDDLLKSTCLGTISRRSASGAALVITLNNSARHEADPAPVFSGG